MDSLYATVQMLCGFRMHHDLVCTGCGKIFNIGFRMIYHQMAVKKHPGHVPDFFHHRRAKGQVRHKIAVHHINMHPVGAGLFYLPDLVSQAGKICR